MTSGFEYALIYSDRRTLCAEIKGGKLIVRAPRGTKIQDIERFLCEKARWIEGHLSDSRKRSERYGIDKLTEDDIAELKKKAREVILPLVDHYKGIVGAEPKAVRINRARTRFGSCSGKNSLNFSCFLMLYPRECIEYVVVHELCHILEHNHSRRFYAHIQRVLPDYKKRAAALKGFTEKE